MELSLLKIGSIHFILKKELLHLVELSHETKYFCKNPSKFNLYSVWSLMVKKNIQDIVYFYDIM